MAKALSLAEQIQNDALDSGTSIGDALRKCIALGARAGSEELRAWAARELRGYEDGTDVPEYRKIAAPMVMDGLSGNHHFEGLQISTHDLPQLAASL